uniref:Uncharacterized protein n=1 Tax=Arabidopsis thaliana TaxID=3702 RepID=Q8GYN1_ARATH|nr:unknown protein [Arabidopsis thaliana]
MLVFLFLYMPGNIGKQWTHSFDTTVTKLLQLMFYSIFRYIWELDSLVLFCFFL